MCVPVGLNWWHDLIYMAARQASLCLLSPPELPRSLTVAWEEGNRGRQHSNDPPIIHRDLKSPNVLINSTWDAKVRVLEGLRVAGTRGYGLDMGAD